jgi:hypothetical protein
MIKFKYLTKLIFLGIVFAPAKNGLKRQEFALYVVFAS